MTYNHYYVLQNVWRNPDNGAQESTFYIIEQDAFEASPFFDDIDYEMHLGPHTTEYCLAHFEDYRDAVAFRDGCYGDDRPPEGAL